MSAKKKKNKLPKKPRQLLGPEAYTSEEWLQREYRDLFGKTWHFACTTTDLPESGDYITKKVGNFLLFLTRDNNGEIRAFHNICRHRGTELLEGQGNAGKTIVCPYHRWTFSLDGTLRGIPDQKECFPDINKKDHGLIPVHIGEIGNLVFVCPAAEPEEDFQTWLANMPDHLWPHNIKKRELKEYKREIVYEMQCNWKVFYENAIDGYHLAHLHEKTLGGPKADKNSWEPHGRHLIWYSTERGHKHRSTVFVEEKLNGYEGGLKHIPESGYGGVYMFFPTTLIVATPMVFTISALEPVSAEVTLLRVRAWASKNAKLAWDGGISKIPGYDKKSKMVKSSHWKQHPMETGDFQTEDVWVVEKMQRALRSPGYQISELARGAGGEASLAYFQKQILDFMQPEE